MDNVESLFQRHYHCEIRHARFKSLEKKMIVSNNSYNTTILALYSYVLCRNFLCSFHTIHLPTTYIISYSLFALRRVLFEFAQVLYTICNCICYIISLHLYLLE